ncbi:MAG: DUF4827 domain-containing protein [Bacteroidaceae bacterium]
MRKLPIYFLAFCVVIAMISSCSNTKTYADMLSDQKNYIENFIDSANIRVISATTFNKMLDDEGKIRPEEAKAMAENNQYVLFSNGLYLQILDAGTGDTIKTRDNVVVRYVEYNISKSDTATLNVFIPNSGYTNMTSLYTLPDVFSYTRTVNSYSGSVTQLGTFTQGVMYSYYGTSVPSAWLYVINYIRVGAHVRMIVPADLGNAAASSRYLTPYYYDIWKMSVQ